MPPKPNNLLPPKKDEDTGTEPAYKAEPVWDHSLFSIKSVNFKEQALISGSLIKGCSGPAFCIAEASLKGVEGYAIWKEGGGMQSATFVPMSNIASAIYMRKNS